MNVLTDQELSRCKRRMFCVGLLVSAVVSAVLHHWLNARLNERIDSLAIVSQTIHQTVARIPTQRAGKLVICTVTIDQKMNLWSINC